MDVYSNYENVGKEIAVIKSENTKDKSIYFYTCNYIYLHKYMYLLKYKHKHT